MNHARRTDQLHRIVAPLTFWILVTILVACKPTPKEIRVFDINRTAGTEFTVEIELLDREGERTFKGDVELDVEFFIDDEDPDSNLILTDLPTEFGLASDASEDDPSFTYTAEVIAPSSILGVNDYQAYDLVKLGLHWVDDDNELEGEEWFFFFDDAFSKQIPETISFDLGDQSSISIPNCGRSGGLSIRLAHPRRVPTTVTLELVGVPDDQDNCDDVRLLLTNAGPLQPAGDPLLGEVTIGAGLTESGDFLVSGRMPAGSNFHRVHFGDSVQLPTEFALTARTSIHFLLDLGKLAETVGIFPAVIDGCPSEIDTGCQPMTDNGD